MHKKGEHIMTDKVIENNQVTVMGEIVSDFSFSHEIFGEGFYMGFTVDNFKKVRINESDEGTLIMVSAPKGYDSGQYISAINGSTFDYSSYIGAKRISSQIDARDDIAQAINTSKYK